MTRRFFAEVVHLVVNVVLLALLWVLMWGAVHNWTGFVYTFAFGLLMGGVLFLLLGQGVGGEYRNVTRLGLWWRPLRFLWFVGYFLWTLVWANLQVAYEVLTPGFGMKPRLVRYAVDDLTDVQKTALASTITLTPGTLSVDLSDDGRHLYVHCMYAASSEEARRSLDELKQNLLWGVFR